MWKKYVAAFHELVMSSFTSKESYISERVTNSVYFILDKHLVLNKIYSHLKVYKWFVYLLTEL